MTTHEIRRYVVKADMLDEFLDWWREGVPRIRAAHGFTIEWCVVDRPSRRFDWLVAHPGDEADFRAAEHVFEASPEWAAHLARIRPALDGLEASFVEVLIP